MPTRSEDGLAVATFAGGCFWGLELRMQRAPGVLATAAGYAQGPAAPAPTYEAVCAGATGHAEAVRVTYDANACSYEGLLDAFWSKIDPTQRDGQGRDKGTQYRTGVYFHDEAQRAAAEASRARVAAALAKPWHKVHTELAPGRG